VCRLLLCARYLKGGSRERGVQNILVSCGLRGACENSVVVDAGVGGASIGAMLTSCGFFPAESSKDRCRGAPGREGHGAVDLEDIAEDPIEAPGHRNLVARLMEPGAGSLGACASRVVCRALRRRSPTVRVLDAERFES
jgi:hypothetical protein